MRMGTVFALVLTSCCALLADQPGRIAIGDSVSSSSRDVRLDAAVQTVEYCAGDAEVFTTRIQLGLRYFNIGAAKIILFKPTLPIEVVFALIAKNERALQMQRYEATVHYDDQFFDPAAAPETDRPDTNRFIILEPGRSYKLTGTISIPTRVHWNPPLPGTIAPGGHVMRFEVVDWPFRPGQGRLLREKWKAYGLLEYGAVKSQPLKFEVPTAPGLRDCGH